MVLGGQRGAENDYGITLTLCTSCVCFLTGHRLFRSSAATSESFSETRSVGQAEDSSVGTSSTCPSAYLASPEENSNTECNIMSEKVQESVELNTQGEEPEGQEVKPSGR